MKRFHWITASRAALLTLATTSGLFADVFFPITTPDMQGIQHATVAWRTNPGVFSVDPKQNAIGDSVQPGNSLQFWWTDGKKDAAGNLTPANGFAKFNVTNGTNKAEFFDFKVPDDKSITDWEQTVNNGKKASDVHSGNIQRAAAPQKQNVQGATQSALDGLWEFDPLADLPDAIFEIPDIAPADDNNLYDTIYTAVNEGLYMQSNPYGFLGGQYTIGASLRSLGINIVNGQIPGVQGIYFATTPFTFDPTSETGWVPLGGSSAWLNTGDASSGFSNAQSPGVDYVINGIHASTPEPGTLALLGLALVGAGCIGARRRKAE